jgi:integrase
MNWYRPSRPNQALQKSIAGSRRRLYAQSANRIPARPSYLRSSRTSSQSRLLAAIGLRSAAPYASLMIAAGVNAKALTTCLGHSSIQSTFDTTGSGVKSCNDATMVRLAGPARN